MLFSDDTRGESLENDFSTPILPNVRSVIKLLRLNDWKFYNFFLICPISTLETYPDSFISVIFIFKRNRQW